MDRVKLNELKGDLVRCIIPYKDNDGKEKQIEVYSIEGERRKQVLEKLNEIADKVNDFRELALDDYYAELIMEFTDVELDKTSIVEIMKNPKLQWLVLQKELDDMIYELQYERMCDLIAKSRLTTLTGMEIQMEKELEVFTKQIENSNKMINNSNKMINKDE